MACAAICHVLGNIAWLAIFLVWCVSLIHFVLIVFQKKAMKTDLNNRLKRNILVSLIITSFTYTGLYGLTSDCDWRSQNEFHSATSKLNTKNNLTETQIFEVAYFEDCGDSMLVNFSLEDLLRLVLSFIFLFGIAYLPLHLIMSNRRTISEPK